MPFEIAFLTLGVAVISSKEFISSLVPKLDLSVAQQVLSSRLESASAFEVAYRDLKTQATTSKTVKLFANLAVEKSIDTGIVYSSISRNAENRLNDTRTAFARAQREFENLQLELKAKQQAFNVGIEAWKSNRNKQIIGEVFTAVVAVAGGIALACVAPPASAAGIGAGAEGLGAAIAAAEVQSGFGTQLKVSLM